MITMRAFILTLTALTWLVGSAAAQTTSIITGVVKDQNSGVVPGVSVTVPDQGTGFARAATTGREGRFTVPSLPAATYQVTAELQGFRTAVISDVRTAVGDTVTLNVTLDVAALSDTVNVIADLSSVNTRTSELSYLVTAEAVERLPLNGRNYTDLALLQPGVIAYPHRDGGSVVAH